jgi:Ni/Co efflux regulator RcnB
VKNLDLVAASLAFLAVSCGWAAAQSPNDQRPDGEDAPPPLASHADWSKGQRIGHDDWARGAPVDYQARHLRQPARGNEWREIDGRPILAAVATGAIADVVLDAR